MIRHGHARRGHHSREYRAWSKMHGRCRRHPHYTRIGVRVCTRWSDFRVFLADMGPCPIGGTLDREDGTLGYFPSNCRWASWEVQARNQRGRHPITVDGETRLLVEWAAISGISLGRLWARIYEYGWTPERAVQTPLRRRSTRCRRGHAMEGAKQCPTCKREYNAARYQRLRAEQAIARGLILPEAGMAEEGEELP